MKILAVYNLKGGVGKTTAVVNFAYLTSQAGHRTLLWDLDAQGAATFYLRVKPELQAKARGLLEDKKLAKKVILPTAYQNLFVLPADFSLRNMDILLGDRKKGEKQFSKIVQKLSKRYEYLFFDCPPSLSELAKTIFHVSDYLLMPLIPTTLSLETFKLMQEYGKKHFKEKPNLIPFFSMADFRKTLHRETMKKYTAEKLFCTSFISTRSMIEKMGVHRAPLPAFSPDSKATHEYQQLWDEIRQRIHRHA